MSIPTPTESQELPLMRTTIPGPRSRELAARLQRVECRNVTYLADDWPVFWESAAGATVTDADGNRYLDMTSAFGVAGVGHANPAVVAAAREQVARLPHGMGDVHPTELKVLLSETLAELAPGDLGVSLLSSSGSDAVETALKTAALHTGRAGVAAFHGGYHGLGAGSLSVTARKDFRGPFRGLLSRNAVHLPFPTQPETAVDVLATLTRLVADPDTAGEEIGAVLLEPIQGRAGVRIPPQGFLTGLRRVCDQHGLLLILDEIYTGFGRTGRWFACEHEAVVPDLLCVGKALGGGFPISACVGRPSVMASWPISVGESLHTSTFLGNPLGCAMALAAVGELRRQRLPERAGELGGWLRDELAKRLIGHEAVVGVRGRGLMIGLELRSASEPREPRAGGALAFAVTKAALRRGLLVLPSGAFGGVLSLTPPLVISREQLRAAMDILCESLSAVVAGRP